MTTRQALLADKEKYLSKARASLIGLAIGDAMGDLGRNQEYRTKYGIVTNLYPEAKSTDDTEFGILTARGLIDAHGELTHDSVYRCWKKYIVDRGGAKKRGGRPLYGAIENLKRGLLPPLSGQHNVMNIDDGAAMRSGPIGVYAAGDPERAAALAAVDAAISHDTDGIWAAKAIAASVAVAMADGSVQDIVDAGARQFPAGSWIARTMGVAMEICDKAASIQEAFEDLHVKLWTPEHSTAAEAIPQVYAIFRLTKGDFKEGLLWSANFGRDADTISGLVCSLSGALRGMDPIPAAWVAQVRKAAGVCLEFTSEEDLVDLADDLVALSYKAR